MRRSSRSGIAQRKNTAMPAKTRSLTVVSRMASHSTELSVPSRTGSRTARTIVAAAARTTTTLTERVANRTRRRRAFDASKSSWIWGTAVRSARAASPSRRSGNRARMRASRRPTVCST
ncbi:hypothetical protein [Oryzobacter terrae]|uniref:hypothetical protein n=1 Tax=Oryzobacter terrae TaxID=1620385 RepID=UPI00366E59EA